LWKFEIFVKFSIDFLYACAFITCKEVAYHFDPISNVSYLYALDIYSSSRISYWIWQNWDSYHVVSFIKLLNQLSYLCRLLILINNVTLIIWVIFFNFTFSIIIIFVIRLILIVHFDLGSKKLLSAISCFHLLVIKFLSLYLSKFFCSIAYFSCVLSHFFKCLLFPFLLSCSINTHSISDYFIYFCFHCLFNFGNSFNFWQKLLYWLIVWVNCWV